LDKEERDLQIKLAKLQTDVQISLAISLAYFAVCGGLVIGGYQIMITSVVSNLELLKNVGIFVLFFLLVVFCVSGIYRLNQMDKYRKEMNKL
jgi:TRAP-type C4-dicarboxylate transport system permease small subunit